MPATTTAAGGDAVARYRFEAERHWGVLNARLSDRRHVLGDDYTIVATDGPNFSYHPDKLSMERTSDFG